MPGISFWTIFRLFGIVSAWAEKALEDNVITLTEAAELAEDLGPILGIPVRIEIPTPELPEPRQPESDDNPLETTEDEPLTPAQFLEKQQVDDKGGNS